MAPRTLLLTPPSGTVEWWCRECSASALMGEGGDVSGCCVHDRGFGVVLLGLIVVELVVVELVVVELSCIYVLSVLSQRPS